MYHTKVSDLDKKEIEVLKDYYGINTKPLTLSSIGKKNDCSKEYVRQIKESAIRKIIMNLDL